MSASPTTAGPLAATAAILQAIAAAETFKQTGQLPSWATT